MRIRTVKISKLNTESFDKLLVDIVNDNFGYVLQCVENVADSKGCTRIDLKIVFDIPHDSITYDYVHHLFNEYKQIGMDSWWRFSYRKIFDEKFAIHSYPITEKIVEDNYFEPLHAGNGYNHLPWETISEYRTRLFKCINEIVFDMCYENQSGYFVNIYPVFDENKVQELWYEVAHNETLQKYAKELEEIYSGIARYYAEKSGPYNNYTGD